MRIVVLGSMKFADKLVEIHNKLKELGHEPIVHERLFSFADGTSGEMNDLKNNRVEHSEIKRKFNYIKGWHDLILKGDAILVCNYDKGEIKGYIGGNTLIEMGSAYVNNKKIFLLNSIPTEVPYSEEINAMVDNENILNYDLSKIPIEAEESNQELTLKEIAEKSKQIEDEIGLNIDDILNKLTQEVGEFNDTVQKVRGRFCKEKANNNENLEKEIGDVMLNLISICNRLGINPNELPKLAENTLNKFKERKELYKKNLKEVD